MVFGEKEDHSNERLPSIDTLFHQYPKSNRQPKDNFQQYAPEQEQLIRQLEQHIQLLVQAICVSWHSLELREYSNENEKMLEEMRTFCADSGPNSFFKVTNLLAAMDTVKSLKLMSSVPEEAVNWHNTVESNFGYMPRPEGCFAMIESYAILYPELVISTQPIIHFPPIMILGRNTFSPADDLLLLLGLKKFPTNESQRYEKIVANLLPGRLPRQIADRVKYAKRKATSNARLQMISNACNGLPVHYVERKFEKTEPPMTSWDRNKLPNWFQKFTEKFQYVGDKWYTWNAPDEESDPKERCPSCHQDRAYITKPLTRSADEPAIFYCCANKECGHQW